MKHIIYSVKCCYSKRFNWVHINRTLVFLGIVGCCFYSPFTCSRPLPSSLTLSLHLIHFFSLRFTLRISNKVPYDIYERNNQRKKKLFTQKANKWILLIFQIGNCRKPLCWFFSTHIQHLYTVSVLYMTCICQMRLFSVSFQLS